MQDNFELFPFLNSALLKRETHAPKAALIPSVWASEASAERLDKTVAGIYGNCSRKSYYRMTGYPVTDSVDVSVALRWLTGRLIEEAVVDLSKITDPTIYAANGVRGYIEEFYMPFELDLVVVNPTDKRGWIGECKTYYGYQAGKEIKSGKPKVENVMQLLLYLNEVKTGAKLKEFIKTGLKDKLDHPESRNRIEANLELVEQMDDGEIGAKLIYIARDDCARTEYTITIGQDFDGAHYPVIDGQMWKIFTIESIYERFRTLQDYWFASRKAAVERLRSRGIEPPPSLKLLLYRNQVFENKELTESEELANANYLDQLSKEVLNLPSSFLPPAEYEWSYSKDKIDKLAGLGLIGKIKYQDWKKKKRGKDRIGDHNCSYCPYLKACLPLQQPALKYLIQDISQLSLEDEDEE